MLASVLVLRSNLLEIDHVTGAPTSSAILMTSRVSNSGILVPPPAIAVAYAGGPPTAAARTSALPPAIGDDKED